MYYNINDLVSRVPMDSWVMEVGRNWLTNVTYVFPPYKVSEAVTVRLSAFLV